MRYKFKPVTLAMLIGSALMLTACHKNQEKTDTEQTSSQQQNTMKELQTPPVKTFAATPEDAHDVAILEDFDRRFSEMNDEMEAELVKMQKNGDLTAEFERTRKRDTVHSAMQMLKALDLKTEQGRYIQGLFYQYWENQAKIYQTTDTSSAASQTSASPTTQGLGDFLHAQEQLRHWKSSLTPKS